MTIYDTNLFRPVAGFMGLSSPPIEPTEPPLACVVGIPFDCGTHPFRVGSRQGPDSIREQSRLIRPYEVINRFGIDNPSAFLRAVDVGNVACHPGDTVATYPAIEQAILDILEIGAIPISLGGDGAVTLPQLRSVSKHYPDFVVLHIDSHTDTYSIPGYNTATTFTRAAEEKLLNVSNSFHVGTRGGSFMPGVLDFGRNIGYNIISFDDFSQNISGTIDNIKKQIGSKPVYLCFDMDVFDPSCAPGVCTPEWGGLLAREGLTLLRQLCGLNFVAFDINTVSPPHDVQGMTAFLAATVVQEFFSLAAVAIKTYPKDRLI